MKKLIILTLSLISIIILQLSAQNPPLYQPASLKCQSLKKLVDNALKNHNKDLILKAYFLDVNLKFIALVLFYAQNDDALALFWAYIAEELVKLPSRDVKAIEVEYSLRLHPVPSLKNLQKFLTENSKHFATGLEQAINDLIESKNLKIESKVTISQEIVSLMHFLTVECNMPQNVQSTVLEAVKYAVQFSYELGSNVMYDTLLKISKYDDIKLIADLLLKTFIANKKFAQDLVKIIFDKYKFDKYIPDRTEKFDIDTLETLVDAGVPINVKTKRKRENALMIAVDNNNINLVKKLIYSGFPIDEQNYRGQTALIKAVDYGYYEIFKDILEHSIGVQINIKDEYGASALAHAVYHLYKIWLWSKDAPNTQKLELQPKYQKYKDIIKDLVQEGAAVNEPFYKETSFPYDFLSKISYKPLDYADAITDDKEIANLLRSKGAQKTGAFSQLKQFYNFYIKK